MALLDRTEIGLTAFRFVFWLSALITLYWEMQLISWLYKEFSTSGALRYVQVVIREFLAF